MIKTYPNKYTYNQKDFEAVFERSALSKEKDSLNRLIFYRLEDDLEPIAITKRLQETVRRCDGLHSIYQGKHWPQSHWYRGGSNDEAQVVILVSETKFPRQWEQAILNSKKILDLKDDWDGEGACAYSVVIWNRAIEFLKNHIKELWKSKRIWLPIPHIDPGPNGSIDLHWRTEKKELLMNIPSDINQPAGYYGDELGKNSIKGKLDTAEYQEWIMLWLVNQ